MKNIYIENLDSTINSIQAIGKVVTGSKFIINNSGMTCLFKIPIARIKLQNFNIKSDDEISFCINDFGKFLNYLKLIKNNEKVNSFQLGYNTSSLIFNGNIVEFKYNLCREEIIEPFIDSEIKSELVPECVFQSEYDTIRDIISNKVLISDDLQSITYKLEQDPIKTKMMFVHLSDVQNPLTNSVKMLFGTILNGSMSSPVYFNTDRIQLATILKSDNIVFEKSKNVLIINILDKNENDELMTSIKIYTSLLKGPE